MAVIGWVDTAEVVDHWEDAHLIAPDVLARLLATAHEQCEAYAPVLDPVPERYITAQILQARALWQMQRQGPGDTYGPDGFQVTVYPLDARIRALLRPRRPGLLGGVL